MYTRVSEWARWWIEPSHCTTIVTPTYHCPALPCRDVTVKRAKRAPFWTKTCGYQPRNSNLQQRTGTDTSQRNRAEEIKQPQLPTGNPETKEPWYTIHCYLTRPQVPNSDPHSTTQPIITEPTSRHSMPYTAAKQSSQNPSSSQNSFPKTPASKIQSPLKDLFESQGSWLSSLSAPPEVMNTSRAPLPAVCQICRSHR